MADAKINEESKIFNISWVLWPVLVAAVISAGCAIYFYTSGFDSFFPQKGESFRGDWGTFGDFFGGVLNPIFSFLALLVLLFTLWQTRSGLALSQKSLLTTEKTLEITKEELELTRAEVKKSAEALEDQSKSLRLQNFEHTFFQLLDFKIKYYPNLKDNQHSIFRSGLGEMNTYLHDKVCLKKSEIDKIVAKKASFPNQDGLQIKITKQLFRGAFVKLDIESYSSYIQQMHDLLLFTNTCPQDKTLYLSLIRANLSTYEMLFLFFYSELNDNSATKLFVETDIYQGLENAKKIIFPKHNRENIFHDDRFN